MKKLRLVAALGLVVLVFVAGSGGTAQANQGIISTPDPTIGNIPTYASMVLDSAGKPVISYYDGVEGSLKLLHCDDVNCAGDESANIATPDTNPPGNGHDGSNQGLGLYTSLRLDSSGNPVVAYHDHDNGRLKLLHCTNANCTGGTTSVVDPGPEHPGSWVSLALDSSGYPVMSYRNGMVTPEDGDLRVAHCNDANCVGGNESIVTVDSENNLADVQTSIALDASGNPVVSYSELILSPQSYSLKLLRCDDPNCSGGGESIERPVTSTGGNAKLFSSLKLDGAGNPVVSYATGGSGSPAAFSLWVLHCDDWSCAGTESPHEVVMPEPGNGYFQGRGYYSSLILDSNGYPVIGHSEFANDNHSSDTRTFEGTEVFVTRCLDAVCSGSVSSAVVKAWAPDSAVWNWAIALDSSNKPVVVFQDMEAGTLGVVHCLDANCEADLDGDGCPDAKENQSSPGSQTSGGLRDPSNEWDYFDPTHDGIVRIADIQRVTGQYYIDFGNPNYTTETDRTDNSASSEAWV